MDIFGRNMLDDWDMKETLDQLIGIEEEKPFECVGSRDEINTAIVLTIKGLEEAGEALPRLLSYYKTTDLYRTYEPKGTSTHPIMTGITWFRMTWRGW